MHLQIYCISTHTCRKAQPKPQPCTSQQKPLPESAISSSPDYHFTIQST